MSDKYFSIVEKVIECAEESTSGLFSINESKKQVIRDVCGYIEDIEKLIDMEALTVSFDKELSMFKLDIICGYFTIRQKDSDFYKIIESAKMFSIKTYEVGDLLELTIYLDGVWDRTNKET